MAPLPSSFGDLPGDSEAVVGPVARATNSALEVEPKRLVGLIRNSKSHRNKGHADPGMGLPGVITVEPKTKPELESALADFAERNIDVLAISGGDGTIRDVLTRGAPLFGDDWPAIAILPKGKTNALAFDLGIPSKWTLAQALDAAQQGRIVTRRPLVLDQLDGDQRVRYGFLLGAGIFNAAIAAGQVAHRYGAFQSFAVGVTAAFGVVQALFGFGDSVWRRLSGIRISSNSDGNELPQSAHAVAGKRFLAGFTTLTTFPLGLHPFGKASGEMAIRYMIIDRPLRRAVALVPAAALGLDTPLLRGLGLLRGTTGEFTIGLDDSFILDGETFPSGTYHVRMGPELHFVAP